MPSEVHDWIIRLALHKIVGDIFLSGLLQARCQMLGAFAIALAHDVVIVARERRSFPRPFHDGLVNLDLLELGLALRGSETAAIFILR